jgi:hypothetical protein
MFPSDRVTELYPQALGSLFVALYDSQGYGGGILIRLHTGTNRNSKHIDMHFGSCESCDHHSIHYIAVPGNTKTAGVNLSVCVLVYVINFQSFSYVECYNDFESINWKLHGKMRMWSIVRYSPEIFLQEEKP